MKNRTRFPLESVVNVNSIVKVNHTIKCEITLLMNDKQDEPFDLFHSRVIRNQQNLYPKFLPTAVVKLLQYSVSRVELRDGFSSYK